MASVEAYSFGVGANGDLETSHVTVAANLCDMIHVNMEANLRQNKQTKMKKKWQQEKLRYFYVTHRKWRTKCKQKSFRPKTWWDENEHREWKEWRMTERGCDGERERNREKIVMIFVCQSLVIHQRWLHSFPRPTVFVVLALRSEYSIAHTNPPRHLVSVSVLLSHVLALIYCCRIALSTKSG